MGFTGLGKAFTVYGGKKVQVFNRLSDQVYADAAGSYCPFTAVDLWGSTIDLSGWNGGMHEVLCCTLNATVIAAGTWTQKLYRDNVKIFEWSMEAPSWWECIYWFIGNGELSKNGNYRWEIWGVGNLLKTYNFTVINSSEDKGEGKITNYNYPPTLESGERYQVIAIGKNIGGSGAYFRFRLFEGSSEITHGGLVYRGPGNSFTQTLSGTMPNHNLNLKLELWRQT